MGKLTVIKKCENPELLVITPLFTDHQIPDTTIEHLLKNDIKFDWLSYADVFWPQKNYKLGIDEYLLHNDGNNIKYVIMIDRDIISSEHMLDYMYETLSKSSDNIAYCYVDFEYTGHIKVAFRGREFNQVQLVLSNYISSNSMIKLDKLQEIGGPVTNEKYKRLLDWCMWLKFLSWGYYGIRSHKGCFEAVSEKSSISSGTVDDYRLKYELVQQDIVRRIKRGEKVTVT